MRKYSFLIISFLIIASIAIEIMAHEQRTHQYIVREGYKLLQQYIGCTIPQMHDAIGNTEDGGYSGPFPLHDNGHPWTSGKVVAGAFREDEEDVLYGYGNGIGDFTRLIWASITHFWNADGGDDNLSYLNAPVADFYPNAFMKLRKYANGEWEISNYITTIWGLPNGNGVPCATQHAKLKLKYNSLVDMYKNKRIYVTGVEFFGSGSVNYNPPKLLSNENLVNVSIEYLVNIFTWEILGRMCHLLADMSVPAHVHCDVHWPNPDPYENSMEFGSFSTYWDAQTVWNVYGSIMDPMAKPDPLRYLMYDINQYADHFGSRDYGGDDYITPEWYMIPYYPYNIQPKNATGANLTSEEKTNIRDATFPHIIRATAGLLYWFARETGLLPQPFTVNISNVFEFDQTENLAPINSMGCPEYFTAQNSLIKNGKQYLFAGWNDEVLSNPRTFNSNITVNALYKTVHKSNDANAFTNSSQRRLIQTKAGNNPRWLHQVYSSMDHVWLEHSSDGGQTWVIGNGGKPLDNGAGGKNPTIAYSYNGNNFCYHIGVVWQQQDGSTYQIVGKMFTQFINSNSVPRYESVVRRIYPINPGENTESYTVNANPNLVLVGNGWPYYFITFETKSASGGWQAGINWMIGSIEDIGHGFCGPFGYVESSSKVEGVIIGDANTTNVQIFQIPGSFDLQLNLVRQQGTPGAIYSHYLYLYKSNNHWIYNQFDDGMISYPIMNFSPSVVSFPDGNFSACWLEAYAMVLYYCGNSTRYYHGSFVESTSLNIGNDGIGFAAWSEHPGSSWYNKSIRFDGGIPVSSSLKTLSTTGKYIQVGNGAHTDHSNMYVSSFYPFTQPYSFSTSATLRPLKDNTELVTGRGFEISLGDAAFTYRFEDLNVDGENISFVDAPDEKDYGKIEELNNVLLTEPFVINQSSKIVFSERSGFSDSSAASLNLGKDGFINYKLELIDEATGKVLSAIKENKLSSANTHGLRMPGYLLNINGFTGKTVRIKITLETNLIKENTPQLVSGDTANIPDHIKVRLNVKHSNLILTKSFNEENETVTKSTLSSLEVIDLELPTTYALEQNYPNPFNPSTKIKYQIPKDGLVTIKIYDILGEEVKTLVNEVKSTGRYEIEFNASDLASGTYIYQLRVNDFVSAKKMLLIK